MAAQKQKHTALPRGQLVQLAFVCICLRNAEFVSARDHRDRCINLFRPKHNTTETISTQPERPALLQMLKIEVRMRR